MNPAHLDHDALADLAEGLLDDAHAASANAHLDSCAECRERSAEIAEVSRILADVPVPPMPAEVAERIEAAIAAEAMATAKVASISHHRRVRERGRKWHLRVIGAAAATLVVVGAGAFLGVELMRGSLLGSDDHTATTQPPPADRSRTAPFTVVRSGTAYRSATLGDQVTAVVPKSRSLPAADSVSERLQGCVQGITRGAKPVLVDAATYESREATIVVVPTDSATWRVVVAGPSCSADDPAVVEETTIPARTP
ncbi:anti-sigma factor family protein [Thermomonospora catenispora]|uniref:anti-sigma factor family protein n=1 Tax=Thermomonospora catenispora TaxID=2493090 RepID=UPI0011211DF2|nr:hypothetical protein [Thermomonospora catenispora]TNY37715.1 hypothetical protein EIO00_05975 [Thermomonospora catenispora]